MSVFNVKDYGAVPGAPGVQTSSLQAALDACFLSGGGTVTVPEGAYVTGGLRVYSGTHLHFEKGAVLKGSRDLSDYDSWKQRDLEPNAASRDQKAGQKWSNAIIRLLGAQNVTISGEEASGLDGGNCFDPEGEEHFRGPHGISAYGCRNLTFTGYNSKDTGNWHHAIFTSENVAMENVTTLAGHDGVDVIGCANVVIRGCRFITGDDCIAGHDTMNMLVENCRMQSACSILRFGGCRVSVRDCRAEAPCPYGHRSSLTPQEKAAGAHCGDKPYHRRNTLAFLTYFAAPESALSLHEPAGQIAFENCDILGMDRVIYCNMTGEEQWQKAVALRDVRFANCRVENAALPFTLYAKEELPLSFSFEGGSIGMREGFGRCPVIRAANCRSLRLKNVAVTGAEGPLVRTWTKETEIELENVPFPEERVREEARFPFVTDHFDTIDERRFPENDRPHWLKA